MRIRTHDFKIIRTPRSNQMSYQVRRHILPKICVFIYTGTWIISRCCWLLLVQLLAAGGIFEEFFFKVFCKKNSARASAACGKNKNMIF